jgi:hypothetical protein
VAELNTAGDNLPSAYRRRKSFSFVDLKWDLRCNRDVGRFIAKDIPLPKDLNRDTPVEIETPDGIVEFFPHSVTRGTGFDKFCVTIHGICTTKIKPMTQCFVYFKGTGYGGNFTKVSELKHGYDVCFETIIPVPEYWGESQ